MTNNYKGVQIMGKNNDILDSNIDEELNLDSFSDNAESLSEDNAENSSDIQDEKRVYLANYEDDPDASSSDSSGEDISNDEPSGESNNEIEGEVLQEAVSEEYAEEAPESKESEESDSAGEEVTVIEPESDYNAEEDLEVYTAEDDGSENSEETSEVSHDGDFHYEERGKEEEKAETPKAKPVSAAHRILEKRKKKKLRIFNFSVQLILICLVPLVVLSIITSTISTKILERNLHQQIEESLKIVALSLQETYSSLYKGDYSSDLTGTLYKGDVKISGNHALLDALKEQSGIDSSFYFENKTRITTVMRTLGGRSVGSELDPDIYEVILTGEEYFTEDQVIQETNYYAYYLPLFNSDGTVVGAIFAGKPSDEVNANIAKETRKIGIFSSIITIACVVLILLFSRLIAKKMNSTKNFLSIVSTGDLTQNANLKQLKRNDELGDMYAMSFSLQEELKEIVSNIKQQAMQLTDSSNDLLNISFETTKNVDSLYESVEFISNGANDQANQTSDAAVQVSNIGEQIEQISKQIETLTKSASQMSNAEKSSTAIIEDLNTSSQEMIESIAKIANQMQVTNASVKDIRTAVQMIQAIADETDLLSINASIEAAHAGESGKGFAVVAEQISKLAAQSDANATEIENNINKLMEQFNIMVSYMDDVKVKIAEQREKLDLTIENFGVVASGVDTSLNNINVITDNMTGLKKSKDAILDIISDLSAVSEQYAASSSETIEAAETMSLAMENLAGASTKLQEMSESLNNELEIFKL